jgi:hypothetical protein
MNGKRPCKSNRPKERAKILDDFDHCVIKRTIHGLYSRNIKSMRVGVSLDFDFNRICYFLMYY